MPERVLQPAPVRTRRRRAPRRIWTSVCMTTMAQRWRAEVESLAVAKIRFERNSMKTFVKVAGGLLLAVLAIVAGALVWLSLKKPASRPPSTEEVEATPVRVARGKYVAEHATNWSTGAPDRP